MSNYNSIKAIINANVKTNGKQEISGSVLNSVLNAMVNALGAGYQYAGVATPDSNPGTPDTNVVYIAATAGTYAYMGGLAVAEGEVAILKYNGTWTKDVTGAATTEQVSQLGQEVSQLGFEIDGIPGYDADVIIPVTQGTEIGTGTKHNLDAPLLAGKEYKITLSGYSNVVSSITLYIYDENGSTITGLWDGTAGTYKTFSAGHWTRILKPDANVSKVAVFLMATNAVGTGDITFNINSDGVEGIISELDAIDERVGEIDGKIGGFTKYLSEDAVTTDKYRVSANGGISSLSGFFVSNPIRVYKGSIFSADNVRSQSSISMLCEVDEQNNFIRNLLNPASSGSYTYEIERDCYIGISGQVGDISKYSVSIANAIDALSEKVDSEFEYIRGELGGYTKTLGDNEYTPGKYRASAGGSTPSLSEFFYSIPIKVIKGSVFTADNVHSQSAISMLCVVDENNNFIRNLLNPASNGTYSFTIDENCYVGISGQVGEIKKFSIEIASTIASINEEIDKLGGNLLEKGLTKPGTLFDYNDSIIISRGEYYAKDGHIGFFADSYSRTNQIFLPGGTYRVKLANNNVAGGNAGQSVCVYNLDKNYIAGYSAGQDGYFDEGGTLTGEQGTYCNFTIPSGGGYFATSCIGTYSGKTDAQVFAFARLALVENSESVQGVLGSIQQRITDAVGVDSTHLPILSENPIETIRFEAGLVNIFHSFGVIGDSLASGEMQGYHADGSKYYRDMYEMSWGQQIAKITGADVFNFSNGGQSAKGWMTENNARTWYGAQTNLKECYFIGLGHNDKTLVTNGTYTGGIGTVADINDSDYTQNADSYVGWYSRIIQAIKSVQPRAYIFCLTTGAKSNFQPYNEQVRAIVEHFAGQRVYLIDLETYGGSISAPWFYMGNHFSAAGYLFIAYEIMNYVDWIVRKNGADFKYTSLVGTDIYDTDPTA